MLNSDNYLKQIGGTIRQYRKDAGLKQVELAAACELQRTYIVEVESGKRTLSLANLVKIALALDVPLSELISYAEQGGD